MEHYPESEYTFREPVKHDDGTCEVWCDLTIKEGEQSITRAMWLPCMDNRNNALANPDMRKISDTRMRCLTKCISMFGLGHYIYAGEDLPQDEANRPYTPEQLKQFHTLIDKNDHLGLWVLRKEISEEAYNDLFNSFEKGTKTAKKDIARTLEKKAHEAIEGFCADFASCVDAEDWQSLDDFSDLAKPIKSALFESLNNEQKLKLNNRQKAA
jgi:hypothetical protein